MVGLEKFEQKQSSQELNKVLQPLNDSEQKTSTTELSTSAPLIFCIREISAILNDAFYRSIDVKNIS